MSEYNKKPESIRDKLFLQIDNYLKSSNSVMIDFTSFNGVKIFKKFVCGSSVDSNITFIISIEHANSEPFRVFQMGTITQDLIEIKYLDRLKRHEGLLQIAKNEEGKNMYNSFFNNNLSNENINSWNQGEKINSFSKGRDMNSEDLNNLLRILEEGVIDKEYTEKSLNALKK